MEAGLLLKVCCILFIFDTLSLGGEASTYGQEASSRGGGGGENFAPPNYRFQYGVYDSQYGNDFGHEEERNGHETKGRYKVQLPDGRTQVVTYVADQNGYRADVTYEGTASSSQGIPAPHQGQGSGGYSAPRQSTAASQLSPQAYGAPSRGNRRSFSTLMTNINGQTYGYST